MKKILVLIAFVGGITFAANAQTTTAPKKAEVTATPTAAPTVAAESQNVTPVEAEKPEAKKECAKKGKGCCKDKKAEASTTSTTESKKACAGEAKKGKACCAHKEEAKTEETTK